MYENLYRVLFFVGVSFFIISLPFFDLSAPFPIDITGEFIHGFPMLVLGMSGLELLIFDGVRAFSVGEMVLDYFSALDKVIYTIYIGCFMKILIM